MKKFLFNSLIFLLFSTCVYVVIVLAWGKLIPGSMAGNLLARNAIPAGDMSALRFKQADSSGDVDVLILGSSHAYRGYDPRIFQSQGLTALNLGTSSQTLTTTEIIYNKYIGQLKPEYLLIDIYPVLFSKEGVESNLNLLPLFYNEAQFVRRATAAYDMRILNSLVYFSFFGNRTKVKDRIDKNHKYISGGFVENFETLQSEGYFKPSSFSSRLEQSA